jgi:outer membrane protein insertion porin family
MLCALPPAAQAAAQRASSGAPAAKTMPATTAASQEMFASYAGEMVSSVELAGRPDLNPDQFSSLMAQKPGRPFSAADVERTAAALRATGKFKQVRIRVEPEAAGVRVIYVLEPAYWIGIYRFPGAQRFPYSELIQASNYPVQEPFDAATIQRDGDSLRRFLQQQGFFEAQVQSQTQVLPHGVANVDFHVTLHKQAKFGTLTIQGGSGAQDAKLEHQDKSLWARLHGAAVRPGKSFHRSTLNHATTYLQSKLEHEGYLGAKVTLIGAKYHPGTNRADIHFQITPGVKTRVKITGAHLWSWTRKRLLPVYQGAGVGQDSVQEGRTALISYFQKKGYFYVKVDSQLIAGAAGDTVSYRIDKGKKHGVEAVHLAGNRHLPDSRLMPAIVIQKEHLFSPGDFSSDLVRTSVQNLTRIYHSEGFADFKVKPSVQIKSGDIHVTFRVTEGPRDVVNAVRIVGNKTFPESKFAPHGLRVRAGQPYSQAHVEEDRSTIIANYLRAGYLRAGFRETASKLSKGEPHRINVTYRITEGPRVMTQKVITLGREHTVQRLVNRDISAIQPGKPLTESELLTAGSKLYDNTGVFDWAQIDPKRAITTQSHEDVLVKVHEAKRNEFQYGFGFEVIKRGGNIPSGTVALPNLPPVGLPAKFATSEKTFYGPRGTAQYTRNNLRGGGASLSLTAFAGRLDQRGSFYYIDPSFLWSHWKATGVASVERNEENPIFSSQIEQASVQFQRPVDRSGKDLAYLAYSYGKTDLTRVLLAQLVPAQDQHIKLSTLSGNFTRDTRDNPLNAHRGVFDTLQLDFNTSALGSNVDFAKLTGQAAIYKQAFHHIVWADSVRMGLAEAFNNSFVPLSQQFFTGGGNSLRGIPLDSAGPQRAVYVCPNGTTSCGTTIPFPSGGNQMLILNSEARIPLSWIKDNLGYVLFYDGGGVFPVVGFHGFTSDYSNNVGIGLRYETPVGPIRFDVGKDLNPIPDTKPAQHYSWQYFISIGQAF